MDSSALRSKLEHYGQEHLLRFWDQLSEADQAILFEDLESIDLAEMNQVRSSFSFLRTSHFRPQNKISVWLKNAYKVFFNLTDVYGAVSFFPQSISRP